MSGLGKTELALLRRLDIALKAVWSDGACSSLELALQHQGAEQALRRLEERKLVTRRRVDGSWRWRITSKGTAELALREDQ